jgi:hypothetical protein
MAAAAEGVVGSGGAGGGWRIVPSVAVYLLVQVVATAQPSDL